MDEVTDMMRGNLTKIMEREGKLEELEMKADQLQTDSEQFQVCLWLKGTFSYEATKCSKEEFVQHENV